MNNPNRTRKSYTSQSQENILVHMTPSGYVFSEIVDKETVDELIEQGIKDEMARS